MIRLSICAVAAAVLPGGCSPPAAPKGGEIEIVIEQKVAGAPWRVTLTPPAPAAEIDLGPSIDGYRKRHWRIAEGGALVEREGRDIIAATPPARRITSVSIDVEPAVANLSKDYEPFIPMNGGAILYTGHFIPYRDDGERARARIDIIAADGAVVSAFGETRPAFRDWESPLDHPAFVYVGPRDAVATGAVGVVDPSAPAWIRQEVAALAPNLKNALEALFGRALPTPPDIFVAIGDLSEEGRLSYSGDALPGQYQMTLEGGVWRQESPQALGVIRRTTAHEVAHLWQAAARPQSDAVADWIHEGGADALAAEALLKAGYWTVADAAADLQRARRDCAEGLSGRSLTKAENEGRWGVVYACGYVINVAAAGGGGVSAFWRELTVRAAAAGGYDEQMVLDLAGESAGKEVVAAIRDITRLNYADPGLVLARLPAPESKAP